MGKKTDLKVEKWYVETWVKKAKLLKRKTALHVKIRKWRYSWYHIEAWSNNELIHKDYLDKDDLDMLLRALGIVYTECETESWGKEIKIVCENEDFDF